MAGNAKRKALQSIQKRGRLASRGKAPTLVIAIGDAPDDKVVAPTDSKEENDMKTEKKKGGTKGKKKGKGGY